LNPLVSAGRIVLAVLIYFLFAFLASFVIKRFGGSIKQMEERGKGVVPLVGTVANLVILAVVLLLFMVLDKRTPTELGIGFRLQDVIFTLSAAAVTVILAVAYVYAVSRAQQHRIERQIPSSQKDSARVLLLIVGLLLAVSAQEEVLFRGYVVANLNMTTAFWIIVISTAIFVLIHLPTNRVGISQVASWILGGLLLVTVYLVSGSIWVAIAVHFVTDFTNVLVFDVAGEGSIYRFTPPLGAAHRAWFRVIQTVVSFGLMIAVYGLKFNYAL
jgi:membrane protease YdiL (CAAX protease family)